MIQRSPKVRGAVIVTRVSTGEQAKHGTSLESQRDMCRAKALALGIPIVAEYEDAGKSGSMLLLRDGMQQAIGDIKAGRADTLICANISRYSRDAEHQQAIRKAVRSTGGRVVFCDMEFDDTPEGDLAFNIMGGFAEYERKVIRARTMRGKRKRAEEGQQPQRSRSPYGYHVVTRDDIIRGLFAADQLGRYQIDNEKADVARRIFEGYAAGTHSLPKLCKELNSEYIPSPSGSIWHEPTIRVILTNPVYKGEPVSGRHRCHTDESRLSAINRLTGKPITRPEVRHVAPEEEQLKLSAPPLVSVEKWNAVQLRLADMKAKRGGDPKRMRMLSGLCYCPNCGSGGRIKHQQANGKKYLYYCCGNWLKSRNVAGDRPCLPDLYPVEMVEQATIAAIRDAIERPEAISAALAAVRQDERQDQDADPRQELVAVDGALAKVKLDETIAVKAQIAGISNGLPADAYADVFADIAARRKDLENRRGVLSSRLARRPGSKRRARCDAKIVLSSAFNDVLTALTDEFVEGQEKRVLLGMIVHKVVPRKEGADIVFAPGVIREAEGEADEDTSAHTFHTTCIGIRTQK